MQTYNVSPRPDWERANWTSLEGDWHFCFDDQNEGVERQYYQKGYPLDRQIRVPFVYQSDMSGIGDTAIHPVVWYKQRFAVTSWMKTQRTFLCFGAVDYACDVWVNGIHIGSHTGGYTPFRFDVSRFCKGEEIEITVRVEDMPDAAQPRGKQYWTEQPDRCWYVASTGIWQPVWLEGVDGIALEYAHFTPDIDHARVDVALMLERYVPGLALEAVITYQGAAVLSQTITLAERHARLSIALPEADFIDEIHCWTPEHPNLYDVTLRLTLQGQVQDSVQTYFGMRKIAVEGGRLLLNNRPLYLKMILDQGYWAGSDLTPPTPQALHDDIAAVKQMGFNGIRKHQKIEDPRFYYWADRLGMLIWGEMPSAYRYCQHEIECLTSEMLAFVRRDYNHPSLICWVPLNESWGVRKIRDDATQQSLGEAMYALLKAADPARIISTNDGWENVRGDIVSIHDYDRNMRGIGADYVNTQQYDNHYPMNRRLYAHGTHPASLPDAAIMVTEYGGVAFQDETKDGAWGYAEGVQDAQELVRTYEAMTDAIMRVEHIQGFCYTQLSDVHQEVNGLLDAAHAFKIDPEAIARINRRR